MRTLKSDGEKGLRFLRIERKRNHDVVGNVDGVRRRVHFWREDALNIARHEV